MEKIVMYTRLSNERDLASQTENEEKIEKLETALFELGQTATTRTEKNIYLIYKDSMDDACTIIGYIEGTSEDADRYCNEHNKNVRYEWEKITWDKLDKLSN